MKTATEIKALRERTENLDAEAFFELGKCYETGDGVDKNLEMAKQLYDQGIKIFTEAVERGDVNAQVNFGVKYYNGLGVAQNYSKAFELFMKAALTGNLNAQNNVGAMYNGGLGVQKDPKQAYDWFMKAALQNHAEAQRMVGSLLETGVGVPEDKKEAFEWYMKSANLGSAGGQNSVGEMYQKGLGIPRNLVEAIKWFNKSAEQSNPWAQTNLGICCRDGNINYKSGFGRFESAIMWFEKAATQGHSEAEYQLGRMYDYMHKDWSQSPDPEEQVWYRKIATESTQSTEKMKEWYGKAAQHGHTVAQRRYDIIKHGSQFTPMFAGGKATGQYQVKNQQANNGDSCCRIS